MNVPILKKTSINPKGMIVGKMLSLQQKKTIQDEYTEL